MPASSIRLLLLLNSGLAISIALIVSGIRVRRDRMAKLSLAAVIGIVQVNVYLAYWETIQELITPLRR